MILEGLCVLETGLKLMFTIVEKYVLVTILLSYKKWDSLLAHEFESEKYISAVFCYQILFLSIVIEDCKKFWKSFAYEE